MTQPIQNEHLCERTIVYCISPPGENQWSKEAYSIHSGKKDLPPPFENPTTNNLIDPLTTLIDKLELNDQNQTVLKKYPLPNESHTASVVKFYNDMAENIKVGQLIEIIGIRGQDLTESEDNGFDSVLDLFTNIPVVHAIAYKNLDTINSSPFNPENSTIHQAHDIRSPLIHYISSVLGGDQLTSEFILLQLLSRV